MGARILGGATTRLSQGVAWFAVVLVSAATAAGLIERILTPGDAPYLLVTREVADHPVAALLIVAVTFAAYATLFRWLCRRLDAWRDGAATVAPPTGRMARPVAFVDYLFARWYRVALALAVVWLPFYLTSFPGQPSPDAANMFTEYLRSRSDFPSSLPGAPAEMTAPFEGYPTSAYLIPEGDSLWSNHHPLFLMLIYGATCAASIQVFDSLVPGLMVISAVSAVFTLVAFGRALTLVGRFVPSWRVRGLALLIVAATPLIALWSMAPHKNQLFSAAFVWWLALIAQFLHSRELVGRRWVVETSLVSLVMAISVQFGWIILVAQAVTMLFVKRQRVVAAVAIGLPALLVYGSISLATSSGAVIPSDPIEAKGVQLQTLALVLREHPDVLTPTERAELSRIFDLDVMVESFDPSSADPMKSTGPLVLKFDTFKYQTVQPEDWDTFNSIVVRVAARHPGTALDALFLKSYRYLDPLDEGTDWYPPWNYKYDRIVEGHQLAPMEFLLTPRKMVRGAAYGCYQTLPCRPTMTHGVKTVAIVLLFAAAIFVKRRFAWLWALPFALQIAIAGVSPLSAGGRYVLGLTYALGLVVMVLAIADRPGRDDPEAPEQDDLREPQPHRTPSGSR